MNSTALVPDPPITRFHKRMMVSYTYDAFFLSDGRSRRRRNVLGLPEQGPPKDRPSYTCEECGKHYTTSWSLGRHKQTHRSPDSEHAKKCETCGKVYVSMPALAMHILTHNLSHKCGACGKAFSRPWLLQKHMLYHTGEKPFGCAHCGKAFADRSNMRVHMQTHSAYKHYACERFNKPFALNSYLNTHWESSCLKNPVLSASQANAPEPELPTGKEMRDERQGIREYAGSGHAHPRAQLESQVQRLWRGLLEAMAAADKHAVPHGREAVQMLALRRGLSGQVDLPKGSGLLGAADDSGVAHHGTRLALAAENIIVGSTRPYTAFGLTK